MTRYDEPDGPKQPGASRSARAGSRKQRRRRSLRAGQRSTASLVLGGLAIVTALVVAGGSLTVYMKYRTVWDSIHRVDVSADLGGNRPPTDPNAINILLIGSDTRAGKNGNIGGRAGITGARSDTVMVVHIAPGAHQVVVLSIPRDSVVPILNCAAESGTQGQTAQPSPAVEQINSTFAFGGPGCLWKTVEQTTGIHIDDFIELTFVGFEDAINALGGVTVCLPAAVDDPVSRLHLSKGRHHIHGWQALAFWRTREGVGEGDDPQRIQRDQFLMASLVQGLERSGLLRSPSQMLRVIDALTRNEAITTDDQMTPTRMLQIGEDMRGVATKAVQFVEVPWTGYVSNANWVQWVQPQSGNLFSAIAHDAKLPRTPKPATSKKSKKKKTPALKPAQVAVAVYNGSTTQGLGASTADNLSARGFDVIGQAGNAPADTYTNSVIEYATAADLPAAKVLARQTGPRTKLRADPQLASPTLHLILGSTFTALQPAGNAAIANLAGTYGGITGAANICSDKAAFAGPNGS
jgi:LCP family protein required for cell wall assembly